MHRILHRLFSKLPFSPAFLPSLARSCISRNAIFCQFYAHAIFFKSFLLLFLRGFLRVK